MSGGVRALKAPADVTGAPGGTMPCAAAAVARTDSASGIPTGASFIRESFMRISSWFGLPKLENRGSTVSLLSPSMEKVGQKTLNQGAFEGKNPFFLTAFDSEF